MMAEDARNSSGRAPTTPDVGVALVAGGRLLVFRAAQYGFAFVSTIIVTRTLGPSGRAAFALPIAFVATIWIVLHLSLEGAAQRLLGRKEVTIQEITHFLSAATIIISAIGVPFALVLGLFLRHDLLADASPAAIMIAALIIPFAIAGQMAAALLFRLGSLRIYGWVIALSGSLQLVLVAGLRLFDRLDPVTAVTSVLIVMALTGIALTAAVGHEIGMSPLVPTAPLRLARIAVVTGLKLHMSSLALYLNLQLDLLLVSALMNSRSVGLYSLAATLAAGVFVATSTIAVSALQVQTDAEEGAAVDYTIEFTQQIFGISVVVATMMALAAYPFITIVYGDEWAASVPPFVILAAAAIGLAIESPTRNLLIRIGRPGAISAAAAAALGVNIVGNVVLIPQVGIIGAALASVMSYWTAALLMVWLVCQSTGVRMRRVMRPKLSETASRVAAILRLSSSARDRGRVGLPRP
jgi:O-antigen/teichoic acid export membrane protein